MNRIYRCAIILSLIENRFTFIVCNGEKSRSLIDCITRQVIDDEQSIPIIKKHSNQLTVMIKTE